MSGNLTALGNATYLDTSQGWFLPRMLRSFGKAVEIQSTSLLDRQATATLGYLISPYASACMMMAIVLNRTVVFASVRRTARRLRIFPKILIRLVTIGFLLNALWTILLQWSKINETVGIFIGSYKNTASEKSLGEFLWGIFVALCVSQLVETFISITSGQSAISETGLTLFEHSLAFQESQYFDRATPQLLIVCLFSILTQLVIHILGLTNLRKYRLIPSSLLGLSMLGYYGYSIYSDTILNFPSIVIFSMVPQLLVGAIILLCFGIYYLAVLVNGDASTLTYTAMMQNLKSSFNLQLNDDFHSALMRFGFIVFNAVDKDEYVKEMSSITAPKSTYLEVNSHVISGYFNQIDTDPELVKASDQTKENMPSVSWNSIKKFISCYKLIAGLLNLIFTKPFKSLHHTTSSPRKRSINDNDRITKLNYTKYLTKGNNELLPEIDNSADYIDESGSEYDPLEYDSEVEDDDNSSKLLSYVPTLADQRLKEASVSKLPAHISDRKPILAELFSSEDLMSIVNPKDIDDLSLLSSLQAHMIKDQRLTRKSYSALNEDEILRELILKTRLSNHRHEECEHDDDELACVVCQSNPRAVIVWPCKCFALCETCRISLGVRGFGICVCCRRKVEGFSKVYIP